jgi:hypothetical protein
MPEEVDVVFDEFVAAWARGERPDPGDYLARVGDAAPRLARRIDRYLIEAPVTEPEPSTVAAVAAWLSGEPTLTTLRARRGRRVEDVVAAIVRECGLAGAQADRVRERYQELEAGLIRPEGIAASVRRAIADALGMRPSELTIWPGGAGAEPSLLRARPGEPAAGAPARTAAAPVAGPPDEVDRLFGVRG